MKNFKLDKWKIEENELFIGLPNNIFANIEMDIKDNKLISYLKVVDENFEEGFFKFDTLEEAVSFVEDFVCECKNSYEVIEKHKELTFGEENDEVLKKIFLYPEDIDREIINYYAGDSDFGVSVRDEINFNEGVAEIKYYLINHMSCDSAREVLLTNGDLQNVFKSFANELDYDLEDFMYCRNGDNIVYCHDGVENFDGVILFVKEKEKNKVLKK